MLPTFMYTHLKARKPEELKEQVERVRLVYCPSHLYHLTHQVGVIVGMESDEVQVSFGEVVITVPPEWLELVG